MKTDILTQRAALQGDDLSVCLVMGSEKPSLYLAIYEAVEEFVHAEPRDTVMLKPLYSHVSAPIWYPHAARDIGLSMRDMGYYRHEDRFVKGVKPEKRRKVERWKLPGRSDLKTLRLDQVAKLHTMVEDELKRRGR